MYNLEHISLRNGVAIEYKMVVKSLSVHQNSINCCRARHSLKLQWEIKIIAFQAFEKYFIDRLNKEKLRDRDWNLSFAANLYIFKFKFACQLV